MKTQLMFKLTHVWEIPTTPRVGLDMESFKLCQLSKRCIIPIEIQCGYSVDIQPSTMYSPTTCIYHNCQSWDVAI